MKTKLFVQRLSVRTLANFAAIIALAVLCCGMPTPSLAQKTAKAPSKGASDNLVRTFASQAFQSLPETAKDASGKEIKIDKSKASEILVPDKKLREVILVASQVSTAAQCKMEKLANAYWTVYRKSLKDSGKWTDQQRFFMAQVFNVAVGFASAREAKAQDGENEFKLKSFKPISCNDKKREMLKTQIMSNISALQKG